MPVAAVAEAFNILQDDTSTWDGKSWVVGPFYDEDVAIPASDLDEWAGAQIPANYGAALRQLNKMCQGADFIDKLGVGVLPSAAAATADDIVVGGSTTPGISIIETGNGGTCKLLFGNSGSNADAGFTYNSTFDSLVLHTAGVTRSYWSATTFAHYQANALIQVGLNDTPGSAGDPLVVLYKGAGNAAISAYHSNEGGTFQRRMDDGIGSAEEGFRRIYDSTGTLVGTTTWAAGATGVTFPGNLTAAGASFWLSGASAVISVGDQGATDSAIEATVRGAAGAGKNMTYRAGLPTDGDGGTATLRGEAGVGTNKSGGNSDVRPGPATGSGTTGKSRMMGADGTVKIAANNTGIGFFNVGPVVRASAYTPTNVTTDRSYDANATTIDEVADVLGTLIADLQAYGLLQ